ncbi:hypothetical protein [Flavivirga spongiicola]|uniref:Uncharacterized protein n=1 Tax=Flavivirga spongiicola TaxID=421621 RepID=A0ABU7XR67_9FLAO|nr:hypothetical protein [Flavivirga sp. MEBiC05379]MDO5978252.1 hypothetical protein [Flavivirga sp. MEBiC05379]
MATIVDYRACQSEDGKEFNALEVQGGVEAVKSKETGRTYLTARRASVSCTFDKATCEILKGTELPGDIKKVEVEPYEYQIPDNGEVIMLSHRFEYVGEDETIVQDHVVQEEVVI